VGAVFGGFFRRTEEEPRAAHLSTDINIFERIDPLLLIRPGKRLVRHGKQTMIFLVDVFAQQRHKGAGRIHERAVG